MYKQGKTGLIAKLQHAHELAWFSPMIMCMEPGLRFTQELMANLKNAN